MFRNKLIIIIAVIVLLVGTGSYFFLFNKSTPNKTSVQTQFQDEVIPVIAASDIGLETEIRQDNRAIRFEIRNTQGIDSVDYQISYEKEVEGERVPEGLIGTVKPEDGKIGIKFRELGTCSSGKCRYDTVVSAIKVTLKIIKTDGKVYQTEKSADVPGV